MPKLDPEKKILAATMIAQGESVNSVARRVGVSKQALAASAKKDELSQLIRLAQKELMENALIASVQNQCQKIRIGKKILDKYEDGAQINTAEKTLLELGQRCEDGVLQSAGIGPAHTRSVTLNQILVDQRHHVSPAVERLLRQHMQHLAHNVARDLQVEDNSSDLWSMPVDNSIDDTQDAQVADIA